MRDVAVLRLRLSSSRVVQVPLTVQLHTMAPVATENTQDAVKGPVKPAAPATQLFNPFYSPPNDKDGSDEDYEYAQYKVRWCSHPIWLLRVSHWHIRDAFVGADCILSQPRFPDVKWAPLSEFPVKDRAHLADPEKKSLLSAASQVTHLTPAIGTEILGIDLRQLSDTQKDELYVSVRVQSPPSVSPWYAV